MDKEKHINTNKQTNEYVEKEYTLRMIDSFIEKEVDNIKPIYSIVHLCNENAPGAGSNQSVTYNEITNNSNADPHYLNFINDFNSLKSSFNNKYCNSEDICNIRIYCKNGKDKVIKVVITDKDNKTLTFYKLIK